MPHTSMLPPDDSHTLLSKIVQKKWWQGSVIKGDAWKLSASEEAPEWWIIASQTCNIYNPNFVAIPVIEVVAAKTITECSAEFTKGDRPRQLHVQALGEKGPLCLEIDIQRRHWPARCTLADIDCAGIAITDIGNPTETGAAYPKWLDKFAEWLGRSYTRVTLPDEFNAALQKSGLIRIFQKRLVSQHEQLYGLYLQISWAGGDEQQEWEGLLGTMPPPYQLEVVLITESSIDPDPLVHDLQQWICRDTVPDPDKKGGKLTRAELAKRNNIHIIPESITGRMSSEITVSEAKQLIRYSMIDHLSNSADLV